MPGSSTTPGRPGTRVAVPVRVAFRLRNGVGAQGMNLYEAQWLAHALPYRRFAAVLTDCDARLGVDMDRYSFHRIGLAPTARCRSPGALRKILDTTGATIAANNGATSRQLMAIFG